MFEKFRKALEWFGHFETINAILHIEFVRTLLLPTLVAAMTGTAGFIGNTADVGDYGNRFSIYGDSPRDAARQ